MGRAGLMLVIGVIVMRLVVTGGYGWFVQQRMMIPIAIAGVIILVFAAVELVGAYRQEGSDPEGARRSVGPTVGWLLAAPLLVLIAVAPTGLGATAARLSEPLSPTEELPPDDGLPEIDDSEGPVEMRVYEFLTRALWDDTASLTAKRVVLEGLVVNDPQITDGFRLTRFAVSCCAADGLPLQVGVHGVSESFDDDTWVRAVVVWRPPPEGGYRSADAPEVVEADVIEVEIVENPPNDPYETPF